MEKAVTEAFLMFAPFHCACTEDALMLESQLGLSCRSWFKVVLLFTDQEYRDNLGCREEPESAILE